MSAGDQLLRERLRHIVGDIWENNDPDDDVETLMTEAGLARMVAVLERAAASLRDFVRDHDDPGVEALGALWEAEQIIGTGPTSIDVAKQPAFARLAASARAWHVSPSDELADDVAEAASDLVDAVTRDLQLDADRPYMTIDQFQQLGFLQEVNRRVLHPAGLALQVIPHEHDLLIGRIWSYRSDPEGVLFADGEIDRGRYEAVEAEIELHRAFRQREIGAVVQPVPSS